MQQLGSGKVIAFDNGANDSGMLCLAAVGVAVLAIEVLITLAAIPGMLE